VPRRRTIRLAKQKFHEEEIRRGLAVLRESGVALDAPAQDLVPRLVAEFGKGKEIDLAVIFCLGKIFDAAALDALVELDRRIGDKEAKKESKRALFKLSQKGFTQKAEESKPAAPLFGVDREIEAYMSAVDGGGGRLIWIAKPQPSHGLQVIQAMLHDRDGLLRFGGMHMKRKELRKMADEIKQQHGVTMIAVRVRLPSPVGSVAGGGGGGAGCAACAGTWAPGRSCVGTGTARCGSRSRRSPTSTPGGRQARSGTR